MNIHEERELHVDVSSWARGLIFGLGPPVLPYIFHARSKGSGETGRMCRLPTNAIN